MYVAQSTGAAWKVPQLTRSNDSTGHLIPGDRTRPTSLTQLSTSSMAPPTSEADDAKAGQITAHRTEQGLLLNHKSLYILI